MPVETTRFRILHLSDGLILERKKKPFFKAYIRHSKGVHPFKVKGKWYHLELIEDDDHPNDIQNRVRKSLHFINYYFSEHEEHIELVK